MHLDVAICSTHVEMFPKTTTITTAEKNLLHACGDVSMKLFVKDGLIRSAPRMWRCFLATASPVSFFWNLLHACGDVSAKSGGPLGEGGSAPRMWRCFPQGHVLLDTALDLLHACGDVSTSTSRPTVPVRSAPRMWRCFPFIGGHTMATKICSTHVEMFLLCIGDRVRIVDLLHACGDVSAVCPKVAAALTSAPRMWRCFCGPG